MKCAGVTRFFQQLDSMPAAMAALVESICKRELVNLKAVLKLVGASAETLAGDCPWAIIQARKPRCH